MPLFEKFKNIFKVGNANDSRRNQLSRYVQCNVDPHFHWEILGDIGDGAFGKVQKARHKDAPHRLAAAKVIEVKEEEDVSDFMVEIEILSDSRHPNILQLFESYFHEDYLWMMLEYCSGGAVDQIMVELEKGLTELQIRYVSHYLCQALVYIHNNNIIHRDLKAGNVLLTSEGQVKLADFGVSAKNKSAIQKRDSFIGTPYWMAPEVMVCETFKDQPYDTLSDIWSLGITLIEMAEVEPPNSEMSPMRVLLKIQKNPPPTLARPPNWSRDFNEFLKLCLQKDPKKRFAASELLKHRFIENQTNSKYIMELLSEAKAEIIEEKMEEMDEDRTSRMSIESEATQDGDSSREGTRSHRSISRQPTEDPEESISLAAPTATSSPKIEHEGKNRKREQGQDNFPQQSTPSAILVNGDNDKENNAMINGPDKKKRAAPRPPDPPIQPVVQTPPEPVPQTSDIVEQTSRPPDPVSQTLNEVEDNKVTNTVIQVNLEAVRHTESRAEIELPAKKIIPVENVDHSDNVQSFLSCGDDTDIQTSANEILDDLYDSLDAEYCKGGVFHSESNTNFCHEQSPSVGLVVDDMIDRVAEQDTKTLSVRSSTIPPVQQDNYKSDDQVLRVRIPSPPAEGESLEDEANDSLSPQVVFRDPPLSPRDPAFIDRRTSAAKEFFEFKQKESAQSGHSNTSRESLHIPQGIIQKQKEKVMHQDDSHSSASSRGSQGEMHRSVHEIAANFHASPASEGESLPVDSNGDVKRRVIIPVAPYNSSPTLGSTSPVITNKRQSAPVSTTVAFQEKASVLNAVLGKTKERKGHRKPPAPPPKSPRPVSQITHEEHQRHKPPAPLPKSSHADGSDESQRLMYFGDFHQHTPSVHVDNTQNNIAPASISPSQVSKEHLQEKHRQRKNSLEEDTEFLPVSSFEYQGEGDHCDRVPLRIGIEQIETTAAKRFSPRNSSHHSPGIVPVPVSPPTVPTEGTPPPEPPIDYDESTPRPPGDAPGRTILAAPLTSTVANILNRQSSIPDGRGSNLSRDESQTSSTRSSGNKSSHGSSSGLHRIEQSNTQQAQSYANSNGSSKRETANHDHAAQSHAAQSYVTQSHAVQSVAQDVIGRNARHQKLQNRQEVKPESNGEASVGHRRDPYRRTVTKKTRMYVVDGVPMTSTTYHIMNEQGGDYKVKEDFNIRKAELQELRRLQKDETRQLQELTLQSQMVRDQQDKKNEGERMNLIRTFEVDIDNLSKTQKKQIEEAERVQEEELRQTAKRLRLDQDREIKVFRERLKTEAKLVKQELDMLPKPQRKDMSKRKKESMELEHAERERQYADQLTHANAQTIQRLEDSHRSRIALLEKQFLQQKHQVMRAREAAIWELEERHLQDKHQTNKQQLKDYFFLQRAQMLQRHQKELDHIKRLNARKEEELIQAMLVEKKRLPKVLRSERKTRSLMFKESLRISMVDPADMVEKMRQFEEKEKKRVDVEIAKQEAKHRKKLDQLRAANEATLKELELIQNEKRKLLVEHETSKLKKYDEEYDSAREEWHSKLKPRKQVLESKLAAEMEEQDRFYSSTNGDLGHYIAASALHPGTSAS